MFTKPKQIEAAFQQIRLICLVTIVGAWLFAAFVALHFTRKMTEAQNRIYILSEGRAMEARAGDREENIPVEARDHVKNFEAAFFTLDPDDKAIAATIGRALYLADGSVKRLYDNLKESGYYNGIIAGNISQRVGVDSISLDTRSYPYYFRCFATQKIIRATSIVTRNLVTEGWLRNVAKSDNNPHGFLIERFNTIENKDLKVEVR
ncbi:MAG: conjugative transposon protein TraK [Bacteroidota bacterium]|nr:conjugative transposon protein TraK [Bacteroidota bacterium]MDP4247376.1 conjugative transposon protein TraK [Bacteroidota bacterium]MDP4260039.1 conjugative transposon protein TraK [Bacteroidota bacterium]